MAIKTPAELKAYFETGDFPTQQQFADLIDSLRHASVGVAIPDVAGLEAALNSLATAATVAAMLPITGSINVGVSNAANVIIPAGTLVKAIVLHTVAANGDASYAVSTPTGTDPTIDIPVYAGGSEVAGVMRYFNVTGELIILSNVNLSYEIHR